LSFARALLFLPASLFSCITQFSTKGDGEFGD